MCSLTVSWEKKEWGKVALFLEVIVILILFVVQVIRMGRSGVALVGRAGATLDVVIFAVARSGGRGLDRGLEVGEFVRGAFHML